ncbi:MAG: hypothetical protein U0930_22280 [Pirellulales bacterium]
MQSRLLICCCLIAFSLLNLPTLPASDKDLWKSLLPPETVSGEKLTIDSRAKCNVLIFLGVECPVARQYGAKLQSLAEQFSGKPVQFIGINSTARFIR